MFPPEVGKIKKRKRKENESTKEGDQATKEGPGQPPVQKRAVLLYQMGGAPQATSMHAKELEDGLKHSASMVEPLLLGKEGTQVLCVREPKVVGEFGMDQSGRMLDLSMRARFRVKWPERRGETVVSMSLDDSQQRSLGDLCRMKRGGLTRVTLEQQQQQATGGAREGGGIVTIEGSSNCLWDPCMHYTTPPGVCAYVSPPPPSLHLGGQKEAMCD